MLKILGYSKGEVTDYMLFFKKPFPGFAPVSKDVTEKLMMYMMKYKKFETHWKQHKISKGKEL